MRILSFGLMTLLALPALSACENGGTDPEDRIPARVVVVDGSGQQGTAGQPLANPVRVRVEDERGRPVPGQSVNFVVTGGGGTVSVASVTTNDQGIAAVQWTLGTGAGAAQTLEARVAGPDGQAIASAPVTATARAGAPARLVALIDTLNVGGAAGGPARDSLAVRVEDQLGNPVAGADVSWAAVEGGGGVSPASTPSNAQGVARAQWTLGPRTDVVQAATASVPGTTRTAFYGRAATTMTILQGNGGTLAAGSAVNVVVSLGSPSGPVPGVRVHWTVLSGGGSVTPASSVTADGAAIGQASAQWTLGPSGGAQTLRASAGPLQQTFTVTAIAQGTRTLVAQVPGRILDADGERILWVDSASGAPALRLRTGGGDVTLATAGGTSFYGRLFPGGALASRPGPAATDPRTLVEYRNGAVQELGTVLDSARVEGSWAAWTVFRNGPVVRRNLVPGQTDTVAARNTSAFYAPVDVGPNGDVVWNYHLDFSGGGSLLYRYRDGVTTLLLNTSNQGPIPIVTDGVNVVYRTLSITFGNTAWWRVRDGDDELLAQGPPLASPTGDLNQTPALNAGWLAWIVYASSPYPPTAVGRLRSPGGTEYTIAPGLQVLALEALSPDGQVVFHRGNPNGALGLNTVSRSLTTPGGPVYDVGPIGRDERVVWAGDRFLLLSAGSVYELRP
jgi:hypothetical protein